MYSVTLADQTDFDGWRHAARQLALAGVKPGDVRFSVVGQTAEDLFENASSLLPEPPAGAEFTVPREVVKRLEQVIHHRDPDRFSFMYRLLLRVSREKNLLRIASDPDIQRLERMEKSIRRDAHKMHAFVRFRKIDVAGEEWFVAWFEPEHYIAEREAGFFRARFTGMKWTILTPWRSISWDGADITVMPGASKEDAPADDAAEDLWRTYFTSIFNPARLKVKAMQAEMPKKYWRNLPEAPLIPGMIAGAGKAAEEMVARAPTLSAPHHARIQEQYWEPKKMGGMAEEEIAATLDALEKQAEGCRRCPLWKDATQTVFGEGPRDADVVFVGEQPGDQEDLAGKPFVGPAGQMFNATLEEVGIDRQRVYVTNAVKHFKFEPRGKRRIHSKPNSGEVQACRWWLDQELTLIQPKLTVALGATALTALSGKTMPVTKNRRQIVTTESGLRVFVTVHPSFLLRIPDKETAARERRLFAEDLAAVRDLMNAA
ncbi:uracil-DNA glycosylase [Rhizobium albus]|nr:uracil-DNA glycosylase [Rhizobium albus]